MFENREQSGELLSGKLKEFKGKKDVIVLGLARGGVVVAKVLSKVLKLRLDVLVVKKIGAPQNPELAIGAVGPKNTVFWAEDLIKKMDITADERHVIKKLKEKERKEQEKTLRGSKLLEILDKTVILVDDGVATGASVLAAQKYLKKEGTKRVVLAVPVIAKDTLKDIKKYFDDVVTLKIKSNFYAVGQFYEYFPQVTNEEVISLIRRS